jgi:hypothetical protein
MARTRNKKAERTLLQALACGFTVENAAHKAGYTERTAYRRLAEPAFTKQVRELRWEMVQRTAGMLTGAGMNSVKTLVDLQQDASVPAGVRRRAARDVLEMGKMLRDSVEVQERLGVVEARLGQLFDPVSEDQKLNPPPDQK